MLKTYIKIAIRNLRKNKLQTGINLLGLTAGTVCCLSIIVYSLAQFGYDNHHENSDQLYRVYTHNQSLGNDSFNPTFATAGPPIAFALKSEFPEVEEATRIVYFGSDIGELLRPSNETQGSYETRGYLADSTVFNMFKFKFLEGMSKGSLDEPNTIVLSKSLAEKMFGSQSALNKTVVKGNGDEAIELKVTGVFDDGDNVKSHLNPNYILTMNTSGLGEFVRQERNFATQNFTHTYIKLKPNSDSEKLESKLPGFLQKYGSSDLEQAGFDKTLYLQKVEDIHLYSEGIDMQIDEVSSIKYLSILLMLAIFIQFLACINFINLSTARAGKRAKEIGIRKTVGADRSSLIKQFLGESLTLSVGASLLSIPITALLLPLFNQLTSSDLTYHSLLEWTPLAILFSLSIITGLLAGIYPALVLSSVKPIKVLKTTMSFNLGGGNLRRALVVFQFVISIGLVATVIIVTQQVRFSQKKDLGFAKDKLLAVRLGTNTDQQNYNVLASEYENIPSVVKIAGSNRFPSEFNVSDLGLHLPGKDPKVKTAVVYNGISPNYLQTVDTKLLVGRDLRDNDSTQVIVNKAAIDAFNIKLENAVGQKLIRQYENSISEFEIVGVTEDYHFASLKEPIRPLLLFRETQPSWLLLKFDSNDLTSFMQNLESRWKEVNANTPFVYNFVDQEVEKLFEEEKRMANISKAFSILAILLSCLGLYGLVSFLAEQKRKEIGIRKVLGASVSSVLALLTKDIMLLVVIATFIATPIAFYFMNNWLETFEYRIHINWLIFLAAGVATLLITVLTVGFEALKAALANPTKSLRTE